MDTRALGQGIATSTLGLGCMGFSQGYGSTDDAESVATIRTAIEHGVTLLDTAMSYGQGHNERLLGRAVAERRDEVHLATKFGIVRNESGVGLDGRPERVRGWCLASLERLDAEVIDLYYLHRVDPQVPIEETVGAMAELVSEGLVRALGVSEVTPDQLAAANAVHPISAVQFEWSLMWRAPETDVVPAARALGVGLVPYSPLGRGLLTSTLHGPDIAASDFRRTDPRFGGPDLAHNLSAVEKLTELATELGVTAGQLALAWLLAQGRDVVPIPGSRRASRIVENAAAAEVTLTEQDLQRLAEVLPPSAWSGDRRSFAVPVTRR